jgi:hypothetical protein
MNNGMNKLLLVAIGLCLLSGCGVLGNRNQKSALGGNVNVDPKAMDPKLKVSSLQKVYVTDFTLDAANVKTDSGVGGIQNRLSDTGGLLGNISKRHPQSEISGNAAAQTPAIVNNLTLAILNEFKKQGIPAERLSASSSTLPTDGWLMKGAIGQVDEGNRAQRAAVGFGMGETQFEVNVAVSDLKSAQPTVPFMVFGTSKDASMKPGGFNPYAMAAKFRMERNATSDDLNKTAYEIVTEVIKSKDTIHW